MIMLRKSWRLGAAAILCTVLWFALLAQRPLFDPDEGRYAEIPREMLSGGDWVIPHLNALVYLEKPPLQYWLTALAFRAFGQTEFPARLCTGLAGYLALLAAFFLGRDLWGFDAGLRAVLFTSASALFVLLGHQLTLDMLLSFWLLAALGCFLAAQARRDTGSRWQAWMLGCWAAMALAVLTKGLIGVVIPGATLVAYLLWQRDWMLLRRLNFRWGLPLFTAIAAPWFALAARANAQFLEFFFIREHFLRFVTAIEHRTEPWWFFAPVLVVGIMPWLPQATRALIVVPRNRVQRGQFDAARVLWTWCVFVLVFFSCSDSKLIPYILPAVPALALLCAGRPGGDSRGMLLAGAFLSLASGAGVLAYAGGAWSSPEAVQLLRLIRPMLFCMSALLALGALIAARFALRGRPLAALAALSGAWFLGSASILVAGNAAQSLYSSRDIALAVRHAAASAEPAGAAPRADIPPDVPVFAVQSYEQSLAFYLQRPVVLVDYRDEFDLGLRLDPQRGIATLGQFAEVWLPLAQGFAVLPPHTLERLSGLQLPMREVARFPDRVVVSRR
ncbi:MAG: glycosyltransferase family 39 protein [Steroidobacteraceae bacterium]